MGDAGKATCQPEPGPGYSGVRCMAQATGEAAASHPSMGVARELSGGFLQQAATLLGKFWAQKRPELWVPILSSRGPWWGVSEKTWVWGCCLVSQKHPAGLEDKNSRLTGPVLFGVWRPGLPLETHFRPLWPDHGVPSG